MKNKLLSIILTTVLSISVLSGCNVVDTSKTENKVTDTTSEKPPEENSSNKVQTEIQVTSGNKVKVVFWHSMGGRNLDALNKLVSDYNASQDKVEIEALYQGTYDDLITKLRATTKGTGPDLMIMYDIGTRWTIDSGYALKMQDFINADNYDISDYEPNILAYYTLNNELYSMPFNCSSPVLIYNKEAVSKAGLDPNTAFTDLDTCIESAQVIHDKAGLEVGGSFTDYSWVFEQLVARQDKDLLDNGNGRTEKATKLVIDENGAGLPILEKYKAASLSPVFKTYGVGTKDSKNAFATGSVGFIFDSCSTYVDLSTASEGTFSVGFAPLPKVNKDDAGGTSVGGGSMWMLDNNDANKAAATWDFVKYATQPEQQAEWAIGTGYFPIRKSATDLPLYTDYITNVNPEIMVALKALRESKPSNAGAVMGVFPQARVIIENEIRDMINNQSSKPEETLKRIVSQINDEIFMYNETN